jgi:hypothetical protein
LYHGKNGTIEPGTKGTNKTGKLGAGTIGAGVTQERRNPAKEILRHLGREAEMSPSQNATRNKRGESLSGQCPKTRRWPPAIQNDVHSVTFYKDDMLIFYLRSLIFFASII